MVAQALLILTPRDGHLDLWPVMRLPRAILGAANLILK